MADGYVTQRVTRAIRAGYVQLLRLPGVHRFPFPGGHRAIRTRIETARVALGIVVLWRLARSLDGATAWFGPGAPEIDVLLGQSVLALAMIVGFATPLVVATLTVTAIPADRILGSSTLGTQVLMIVLVVLLLGGAGRRWSVDALLARRLRTGRLARIVSRAGELGYVRSPAELRFALWVGFVAYAAISLSAIFFHVSDPYWQQGQTVRVMLTGAYMSSVHEFARSVEALTPGGFGSMSAVAVLGQTLFQGGMLFLVRWTGGRAFVVLWGWLFFALSLVALQLTYLPHLEIVLWFLLFGLPHRAGLTREGRALHRPPVLVQPGSWRMVVPFLAVPYLLVGVLSPLPSLLQVTYGTSPADLAPAVSHYEHYSRKLGFSPPNVFNTPDLRTSDHWASVHRLVGTNQQILVPFAAPEDGARLAYHRSDPIYYGNSLRWRRLMSGLDLVSAHQPGQVGWDLMAEVVEYDLRRKGLEEASYVIRVWTNRGTDLSAPVPEKYVPVLRYEYRTRAVQLSNGSVMIEEVS